MQKCHKTCCDHTKACGPNCKACASLLAWRPVFAKFSGLTSCKPSIDRQRAESKLTGWREAQKGSRNSGNGYPIPLPMPYFLTWGCSYLHQWFCWHKPEKPPSGCWVLPQGKRTNVPFPLGRPPTASIPMLDIAEAILASLCCSVADNRIALSIGLLQHEVTHFINKCSIQYICTQSYIAILSSFFFLSDLACTQQ